jgi:putative serine protease PepD
MWRAKDGKFVENWVRIDMMTMLTQLGVIQPPPSRLDRHPALRRHGPPTGDIHCAHARVVSVQRPRGAAPEEKAQRAIGRLLVACSVSFVLATAGVPARAQEPAASAPRTVLALPDLAARITPSVLLLHVFDDEGRELGTGTGFFVSADGRIVTNFHVADGAGQIKATLSDGRTIAIAGVLATDPDNDLALLQAEGSDYPALVLTGVTAARIGDDVVVVGSPHGLSASLSTGIVAAIRERGIHAEGQHDIMTAAWSVQVTAATSPGSSGSPVLTRDGDVIAIVVGSYVNETGISFAIRAELARQLVQSVPHGAKASPFHPPTTRTEILRNAAISGAVFALLVLAWFGIPRLIERREKKRAAKVERRR